MFVKEITVMSFENYFPLWNDLNTAQKKLISDHLITQHVKKGTIIHNGKIDCTGLLLVKSGQLRTYILSDEVTIEAEKDTDLWIIPAEIYKSIMNESAPVANYTNELMATRFSDVMWLMEQIMWKSLDKRVASFLLEETSIEETNELKITHETIANHLGSHREVITRMLRYFQSEGLVKLSRGKITILDSKRLETLQRL